MQNPEFQIFNSVGQGQGPGICLLTRLWDTLRNGGWEFNNVYSLSPTRPIHHRNHPTGKGRA